MTSGSYDPNACCGADCVGKGREATEPCWGEVGAVDEKFTDGDSWWIHACQGHGDGYGKYQPEPTKAAP